MNAARLGTSPRLLYLESLLRPCGRCALLLKSGPLHCTGHIGNHLRDLSRLIALSKTEFPLTLSEIRFSVLESYTSLREDSTPS